MPFFRTNSPKASVFSLKFVDRFELVIPSVRHFAVRIAI